MKKLFLITATAITFGLVSGTSAQTACIQSIQAAVSPQGKCQQFSNPCQVPNDWKKVSSCDLIEEKPVGKRIDEVLERRYAGFSKRKTAEKKPRTTSRSVRKITGGSWLRSERNKQQTQSTEKTDYSKRRVSSGRRSYARNYTKNYAGRNEKTSAKNNNSNRRRLAIASGATRTGALSNKAKWNVEAKQRFTKKDYSKKNKYWKSRATLRNEALQKKRELNKQATSERKAQLRKVWVGESRQGSLKK